MEFPIGEEFRLRNGSLETPPSSPLSDGADSPKMSEISADLTKLSLCPKASEIKESCVKANHERPLVYDYLNEEAAFISDVSASGDGDKCDLECVRRKALGKWNYCNKPSQRCRSQGIGWIVMKSRNHLNVIVDGSDDSNDTQIKQAFLNKVEQRQSKENKDAHETFKICQEIALEFNVISGKWLFHVKPEYVDFVWYKIIRAINENQFPDSVTHAKVSPVDDVESMMNKPNRGPTHVICLYNTDFTDEVQVREIHDVIRKIGILQIMMYKPDIYSIIGIYRNNEWNLRPTIYYSSWDRIKHCAHIDNVIGIDPQRNSFKKSNEEEKQE